MGAAGTVLRPQLRLREFFGGVFDDRKRIPDRDVAIDQGRHLAGRRKTQNPVLVGLVRIERDEHLIEGDIVGAQRQPRPHRP